MEVPILGQKLRSRSPRWLLILLDVLIVLLVGSVILVSGRLRGHLFAVFGVYVLLSLGLGYLVVRAFRETWAAWVMADGEGLTAVDWLGRKKRVRWGDVEMVRVMACHGMCRTPSVYVEAGARRLLIPPSLFMREGLVEEVIRQASLEKLSEDRNQTVYGRH